MNNRDAEAMARLKEGLEKIETGRYSVIDVVIVNPRSGFLEVDVKYRDKWSNEFEVHEDEVRAVRYHDMEFEVLRIGIGIEEALSDKDFPREDGPHGPA